MTNYRKLRELVKLARRLESEARGMARRSPGRADRLREAEGYRVKALYLAGRIDAQAYGDYLAGYR